MSSVATPVPPPPPPPPPAIAPPPAAASSFAAPVDTAASDLAPPTEPAVAQHAPQGLDAPSVLVAPEQQPFAPPTIDPDVELAPRTLVDEGYIEKRGGLSRLPKVPFEVFAAIVIGAILLGAAALSNRDSRSEAEAQQRIAEASLTSAERDGVDMAGTNADLAETNDALETEKEQIELDLVAATAAEAAALAELVAVQAIPEFDTTPLDDEIDELTTENAELLERATAAEAAIAELPETVDTPAFFQFVGERLSARGLSADQAQCLGAAIVGDIGIEGFGLGAYTDQTTATNNALIDSMSAGAASCDIDSAVVFGS